MFIHEYSIRFYRQELNTKPSAREKPYIYHPMELTPEVLNKLTQDELDKIYRDGQEILELISAETFRRLENNEAGKSI